MKNIGEQLRNAVEGSVCMVVEKNSRYLYQCLDRIMILHRFSDEEKVFIHRTMEKFDSTVLVAVRFIDSALSRSRFLSHVPMTLADILPGYRGDIFGLKQLWKHPRFRKNLPEPKPLPPLQNAQKSGGDFFQG